MKVKKLMVTFAILLSLSILLLLISKTRHQIARYATTIINKNKVVIKVDDKIDINDIVITCSTAQDISKIIFKNGKEFSSIQNEYGGDNFEVLFKDSLIVKCGIHKRNWWHTHKYTFSFSKINDDILVDFFVEGKDSNSGYYNNQIDDNKSLK